MRLNELLNEGKKGDLLKRYGKQVSEKLSAILEKEFDEKAAIEYIYSLDTTNNKTYTEWLIKMCLKINNDAQLNQLVKFTQLFNRMKNNKQIFSSSDINTYQTMDVVDKLLNTQIKSKKEQKQETEKELIDNGDVDIIYNGKTVKVVKPYTYDASCFYGKKTKWCTTSSKDSAKDEAKMMINYFSQNMSMYYVIIKGTDKKFGLVPQIKHYVNELDIEVPLEEIFNNYPETKQAFNLKELAKIDGEFLKFIDDNDYQLNKISHNPLYIAYINNPSDEMVERAISLNPNVTFLLTNVSSNIKEKFNQYFSKSFLNQAKHELLEKIDSFLILVRKGYQLTNEDVYYAYDNINARSQSDMYPIFTATNSIFKSDIVLKKETYNLILKKYPYTLYLFYLYKKPTNPKYAAKAIISMPQMLKDIYNKGLTPNIDKETIETLKQEGGNNIISMLKGFDII